VGQHTKIFQSAEEKRTDVNIAVYMLDDAYQDVCDQFVLITGDSDLVPVIKTIKLRFPAKKVLVYIPARGRPKHGFEMRGIADRVKEVPLNLLSVPRAPAQVPMGPVVFFEAAIGGPSTAEPGCRVRRADRRTRPAQAHASCRESATALRVAPRRRGDSSHVNVFGASTARD
jgi:hypothetical protein